MNGDRSAGELQPRGISAKEPMAILSALPERKTTPIDRPTTFTDIGFHANSNMIETEWGNDPTFLRAKAEFEPEVDALLDALEAHTVSREVAIRWLLDKHGEAITAAGIDELTRLYNRTTWAEQIESMLSRDQRSGNPTSVIMVDLDNFKLANDKFGHPKGDAVLKGVADALRHGIIHTDSATVEDQAENAVKPTIRRTDVAARYGGDELIAGLSGATADEAAEIALRIQKATPALIEEEAGPDLPRQTMSIGIAEIRYERESTLSVSDAALLLTKMADAAVYVAKELGKDRIVKAYTKSGSNTIYYLDLSTGVTHIRNAQGKLERLEPGNA